MKKQWMNNIVAIVVLAASVNVAAGDCDDPTTSEQIAQCLGVELRESDASINASYKQLMAKLDEPARLSLRAEQRAWIKDRDMACSLDNKETDREKWYQALLRDYGKTVCVTRYTRARTAALKSMLDGSASAVTPKHAQHDTSTKGRINKEETYDHKKPTKHATGKWYFELAVDYAKVVEIEPTVFMAGVSDEDVAMGLLDSVRKKDAAKAPMRYGIALDLDNGKLYQSRNGEWIKGEPGSNQGIDIKLGRDYYGILLCVCDTLQPYIEARAFIPNFGDNPMSYAPPAGYRAWRN
jgi:uncharacterized protein YecT (DUF1311 family)